MSIPSGNTPLVHVPPSGVRVPRFRSMIRSRSAASPRVTATEYGVSRPFERSEPGLSARCDAPGTAVGCDAVAVNGAGAADAVRNGAAALSSAIDEPTTADDDTRATRTSCRTHPLGVEVTGRSEPTCRRADSTRPTSATAVMANQAHSATNSATPTRTTVASSTRPPRSTSAHDPLPMDCPPTNATAPAGTANRTATSTTSAPKRTSAEVRRRIGGSFRRMEREMVSGWSG